ncbi:Ser-Thr-rich glycosyl-phosphatidyl-inositol-anchored membrane family-domain-containing protein [Hypoxylon sp. NC1633]|nr:Ser-Thr-rich glycosyl-phosphatidyl-inositol-anchored membrane family-domain-containing protein [Hypoxylon sp. NC1633]
MKSVIVSVILAALPAWVQAVLITNSNFNGIEAGKPFEITWSGATGAVTLTLKDGPADNLKTVSEIVSGATGESYSWTPSSSLSSGTYALEISDGTDVNYSQQFDVSGGSASSAASSTVSSTSASSTASSTVSSTSTSTSSSASSSSTSESSTSSGSITSSSSHASTTSSTTKTSASAAQTAPPNTNAAQTAAPFVVPMLLAVGAAFM